MLKRLLLIVIPLSLVCGLLEVVFRTAHPFGARVSWTEPDRHIGWRFTPGREYWFFGENDHAITGRINSMGWRDRERTEEKPVGVRRIAVIGDSFVEAFQVELDSTFTAIAERHMKAEVMNFGRSGMSPAEEELVLAELLYPVRPDEVLLLFTPQNDIADVNPSTTTDPCRPFFFLGENNRGVRLDQSFVNRRDFRMREIINPLKQRSALVSLVSERYNVWRQSRAQKRVATGDSTMLTREQRMCTDRPDSVFVQNYALCKALISQMAALCAKNNVRFSLASVPLVYTRQDIARLRALDPSFDPLFWDRDLGALADSSDFRFIPLTGVFMERSEVSGKLHWQHWNYAGHRLVADRLWASE